MTLDCTCGRQAVDAWMALLISSWKAEPALQARASALRALALQASWALLAASAVPEKDCAWRVPPVLAVWVQTLWAPWTLPGQVYALQVGLLRSAATALMQSPAAYKTPFSQMECHCGNTSRFPASKDQTILEAIAQRYQATLAEGLPLKTSSQGMCCAVARVLTTSAASSSVCTATLVLLSSAKLLL